VKKNQYIYLAEIQRLILRRVIHFLTFADNRTHQKIHNRKLFPWNWQLAFDQIVRNFCPAGRDEKE